VLTGCGIAYFVSRLTAGLRQSRQVISMAQQEGERARRTTEVATLAAGIAHELATPLGTIAVVSQDLENLAGTTCGNACCKEDARVIRQEVERCRRIIEKLGKAGQAPDEARKPLDWDNLSESLHGYLPESIRGRLQTHIRPSGKRPLLPTSRLLQSISILIKNAAEASPPGSTVTFEAEIADGKCVFRVKDRGPGFPPEIVGRLGEPLVTTKSRHGGLGLGLYLVKAFIRDQGGDFRVEPGSPTTVSMVLPVDEESS
jgi:two-component system sensor histidine kinase RegB